MNGASVLRRVIERDNAVSWSEEGVVRREQESAKSDATCSGRREEDSKLGLLGANGTRGHG